MRVLICGGGVIGASIAYFIARRGADAVVVERHAIAGAASGKSGGFLALDWCDGTPLQALARRSFALHASLADEIDADWGYRRLTTYAGYASAEPSFAERSPVRLDWLSDAVMLDRRLGTTETTAQVNPGPFTEALIRAAEALGASVVKGAVDGIRRDGARVVGIEVDGQVIEGDAVVVAMGPWSALAAEWLPLPHVFGLKGHSLVFDTGGWASPDALFLEYEEPDGTLLSPEIFPRADGTVWACAISSETPLPLEPADVAPDARAFARLETLCRRISPVLGDAKIVARQACFRPVVADGLPLIGRVPGLENAFVATAHSVWGILNAPATGEAMAELILDGAAKTLDLSPFEPARLRPRRRAAVEEAMRRA